MIGAPFTWGGAIVAGLARTAAMTMLMYMAPMMGLPKMDIIGLLGAMFTPDTRLARAMGTLMHAVMGIIFALIYARIWNAGLGTATWWIGGVFGAIHGLLVMMVMPLMLRMPQPLVPVGGPGPSRVSSAGAEMEKGPLTMAGILMGHIVFGVIVGLVYAGFTRSL